MNSSENPDKSSSDELAEESIESGRLPEEAKKRYLISMIVIAGSASCGNILLKYGLDQMQFSPSLSVSAVPEVIVNALSNLWLDAGIALLIVQFVALTYALRYGPLSLTVPIRGAATYAGTALLAVLFLGDQVNVMHWVSIFVIIVGITLIGISGGEDD